MIKREYPKAPNRTIFTALLSLACSISLFSGCSTVTSQSTPQVQPERSQQSQPSQPSQQPIVSVATPVESKPKYEVKITGLTFAKDYSGKDVLVVDYAFTNNSDKEEAFMYAVSHSVYQDGVECNDTVIGCDSLDTQLTLNKVKPGVTYNVQWGYYIDADKPCDIKVTDLLKNTVFLEGTLVDGKFTEGSISVAPPEADPTKPKYQIEITKAFLSKDYKDEPVLVIDFAFTNNSEKEEDFMTTFVAEVYQNGVECNDTVIGCDDVDTQKIMNKVQPGVTYNIQRGYHIDTTAPCEVKVTDLFRSTTYIEETISNYT